MKTNVMLTPLICAGAELEKQKVSRRKTARGGEVATQNRDVTVPMGRRRAAERTKNPARQWLDGLAAWVLFSLGMFSGPLQAGWLEDIKSHLPGKRGAPPHRIVDSGYWVQTGDPHRMVNWVDRDRVIFVGGVQSELELALKEGLREGGTGYPVQLYIWDTRTNRVDIYSKIRNVHGLCFRNGYIRYYLPGGTDDQRILKSGPFGQETETLVDRKHNTVEALYNQGMQYSELRCKPFSIAEARISPTRLLLPLLEGHGYLDIHADGPYERQEPVRWYKDRGGSPVDLPLVKRETAEYMVSYAEWSNTYLIATERARHRVHNSTGDWPKNVPRPLYLMKPGGEVQQLNLPYVRDLSSARRFYSAKIGIAFLAGRAAVNGPGKAGVYIWTGGVAVHLALPGESAAAALSPDGCKLAVAIDPRDHGGSDRYYLKMIDFCSKGGK